MTTAKTLFRVLATLVATASLAVPALSGPDAPPAASVVVGKAQEKAAKENKKVFVGFTASWCGWCKRMAKTLSDPQVAAIMDKYFVSVWLDVQEQPEKASLENPGAEELMDKMGGNGQGIPFHYFTDAKGKKLMDSKRPASGEDKGGNVGCPYEEAEIAHWMKMLKSAAPKMTEAEANTVQTAFAALKKADGKGG
jgi:thiol-disulfide isomerase/thioredoxin